MYQVKNNNEKKYNRDFLSIISNLHTNGRFET